jgi:methylenetetrahydrofolate reductase (NADPH)
MAQAGLEPNFQMVCRDRNRIAMQSDILGLNALGIYNMLCLSGDHQHFGNHPQSKNVYDIDHAAHHPGQENARRRQVR